MRQSKKEMALEKKEKPSSAGTEKTASKSVEPADNVNISQEKLNDKRTRNWTFVVYPESAPENWREILDDEHIEWVESPLHDKDLNSDGTVKKPHWHIVLLFGGKKSYEQVKKIADKVNAPSPKYVQSIRAFVRYLAHLDNPKKAQYDKNLIIGHGVDVSEYLQTAMSVDALIMDIEKFICKNQITEYSALCDCARNLQNEYPDWHKCISTHTIHFRAYVSSKRYIFQQRAKIHNDTDAADGE